VPAWSPERASSRCAGVVAAVAAVEQRGKVARAREKREKARRCGACRGFLSGFERKVRRAGAVAVVGAQQRCSVPAWPNSRSRAERRESSRKARESAAVWSVSGISLGVREKGAACRRGRGRGRAAEVQRAGVAELAVAGGKAREGARAREKREKARRCGACGEFLSGFERKVQLPAWSRARRGRAAERRGRGLAGRGKTHVSCMQFSAAIMRFSAAC
jgi:cytidine deaminase